MTTRSHRSISTVLFALLLASGALGMRAAVARADDFPKPRIASGAEADAWREYVDIREKVRAYRLPPDQAAVAFDALGKKAAGLPIDPFVRLSRATSLFAASSYSDALSVLESIKKDYPTHALCRPQGALESVVDQNIGFCRCQIDSLKSHPVDLSRPAPDDDEIAVVETSEGVFKLGFFSQLAPNHVKNFKNLAREHKFDGTYVIHVYPDFWVRAGDLQATDPKDKSLWGATDAPYSMAPEPSKLLCVRGSVVQDRPFGPNTQGMNDHGSDFNICLANPSFLDGIGTVFAEVIEGLDVVESISRLPVEPLKLYPQKDVQIRTVTIVRR
jgi:peptidyl-prolyl cis-trans isomerase B (cyclophilin B)